MKYPQLFCTGMLLAVVRGFAAVDNLPPPGPPFELVLSVNDAGSDTVYRGWPLILRGDAVLMEDVAAPFALEVASLALTIVPASGSAVQWPLRRMTELASAPLLGPANEGVRIVWLLTAEQSDGLVPGTYAATLSWAGRESSPLKLTIADAPATLSADDEVRRTVLQCDAALLLGDAIDALNVLETGLVRHPDSIDLLVQCARVHQQRAEYREALQATQHALTVFQRDFPRADHPPVSILAVQNRVIAALVNALPAAGPGVPTATANPTSPAAPTPALKPPAKPVVLPGEPDYTEEPRGQWAVTAEASSQYGTDRYAAAQAVGAPDTPTYSDHPKAWASKTAESGIEWLLLHFAAPVHATEVRVRQTFNPGAIVKIEVLDTGGEAVTVRSGRDTNLYGKNQVAWLVAKFPATGRAINAVRITLDTASVKGWNEIDAVQLVGDP